LCDRWVENPYFQYFCGEEFFQHALVFDRSSLTRWRQRMGEEKLQALLQESLAVAPRTDAMKPSDLARVVIDTTVQPKAVMIPTDAKLLNWARERLVRLTKCRLKIPQLIVPPIPRARPGDGAANRSPNPPLPRKRERCGDQAWANACSIFSSNFGTTPTASRRQPVRTHSARWRTSAPWAP
jgi:hypothetical protein